MHNSRYLDILQAVREEREKAADVAPDFPTAVRTMANSQLRTDALRDVGNVAMTALGVGAGARGLLGLIRALRPETPTTTLAPATLPLPFPAEKKKPRLGVVSPDDEKVAEWQLPTLASTDAQATSKGGLSLYAPAVVLAGLGSAALGWKGVDSVLDARRRAAREEEMGKAKQQFEQALLSQYDHPLKTAGEVSELSRDLDSLFDKFAELSERGPQAEELVKQAEGGILNTIGEWVGPNNVGKALGGYGVYAGLSGLLAGNYMFDKARKRSTRSIVENALAERENRRFQQAPTEIYAVPQPVDEEEQAVA